MVKNGWKKAIKEEEENEIVFLGKCASKILKIVKMREKLINKRKLKE